MPLEYKMVNITFKTPGQVQALLEAEGRSGWDIHGAGSSYLFLARSDEAPREHLLMWVLLRSMDSVLHFIDEHSAQGWHLATLGTNFAFFSRVAGLLDRPRMEYRRERITLKTPGGILALLNTMGARGWSLRGMGADVAFLEKGPGPERVISHALEGVMLKTPGRIQELLDLKAGEGFRLASVTRTFLAFSTFVD